MLTISLQVGRCSITSTSLIAKGTVVLVGGMATNDVWLVGIEVAICLSTEWALIHLFRDSYWCIRIMSMVREIWTVWHHRVIHSVTLNGLRNLMAMHDRCVVWRKLAIGPRVHGTVHPPSILITWNNGRHTWYRSLILIQSALLMCYRGSVAFRWHCQSLVASLWSVCVQWLSLLVLNGYGIELWLWLTNSLLNRTGL